MSGNGIYRIGVVSDTHGILRDEVIGLLKGCDAVLHAGDIDAPEVVEVLQKIAPLYVVRGNADREWAKELPKSLRITLKGITFFIVHNKKDIDSFGMEEESSKADIVVYGHSHKYDEKRMGAQIWLNPGSCGRRRFSLPVTMAVIEIAEDGRYRIIRKDISASEGAALKVNEKDRAQLIRHVIKDMEKGIRVEDISKKNRIPYELAEQICRMYATHPGIDVDGILDRIS